MTSGDTPHPRYSLTFQVGKQRHLFVSVRAVAIVYGQIQRAAAENHLAIAAYCFMPDHVHLLVAALDRDANYPRFVARAKQYSGVAYARAFGGRRLWDRHMFHRQLAGDDDLRAVACYIISNPVRAGLVDRLEDYPFVGSDLYAVAGRAPVTCA